MTTTSTEALSTTQHPMTIKITNSCICSWCPECEMLVSDPDAHDCDECGTELEYTEGCTDCWELMLESLTYLFSQWPHHEADRLIVTGSNMGWRHRSGYTIVEDASAQKLSETISVDSEWRQTWQLDGDALTVTQTHHDSLGELYDIIPLTYPDLVANNRLETFAEELIDLRTGEIVDEAAMSRHCRNSAGPFEMRGACEVAEHMGTDQEAVWAAAERVARAEWADQSLRAIRYADLVDELRFD